MARTRERERTVAVAAMLLGSVGALLGGCAGTPLHPRAEVAPPPPLRDEGPLVFATYPVASAEAQMGVESQYGWFAYGRNDGEVSARWNGPIEATRQWPVPPRPAERHVRFWYWVQR